MDLHYERLGEGPPLVILHGLFGAGGNWRSIARSLAADRTIYLVDQRNHGRSAHNDEMSYDALAGDLADFLDGRDIGAAAVMGHSMGGKAAMLFAVESPERVERLVVVDTAPRAYRGDELLAIARAMRAVDTRSAASRAAIDRSLAEAITDERVRGFLLTNLRRDEDGRFVWRLNLEAIVRSMPAISAAVELGGGYPGPALFIGGASSTHLTPSDGEAIRRAFPLALIHSVAGAGHWVHADRPSELLAIVAPFLAA